MFGGFGDARLWGLCLARAFCGLIFMNVAAALPALRQEWGLSATQGGSIVGGFNLGYAVSLVICSGLADRFGAKRVYLASLAASALAGVAFALGARSFVPALVLYTLVGTALGGTYTTGLMILAELYPARRGAAMGLFIASTSLGYAFSLFLSGLALKLGGIALCFWLTGLGPALGALLAYKVLWAAPAGGGRRKAPAGTFSRKVLKNRPAMYLIAGYSLHNYELLGMWAWTPAFLAACLAVGGTGEGQAVSLGSSLAGVFHLLGLLASLTVGALSDRLGRGRVLTATAAAPGCAAVSAWIRSRMRPISASPPSRARALPRQPSCRAAPCCFPWKRS